MPIEVVQKCAKIAIQSFSIEEFFSYTGSNVCHPIVFDLGSWGVKDEFKNGLKISLQSSYFYFVSDLFFEVVWISQVPISTT